MGKIEMKSEYTNTELERDLKMLEYFQDEFQYRHRHFWGLLIKLFLLDIVMVILPFASEIFGISLNDTVSPYMFIFPIFGIFVAWFTKWILLNEAERMSAVNRAKYRINKRMPLEYQYEQFVDNTASKKNQSVFSVPEKIFRYEVVLCIISILILKHVTILMCLQSAVEWLFLDR